MTNFYDLKQIMILKYVKNVNMAYIQNRHFCHFSLFKKRLGQMFDDEDFLLDLSHKTRIYPDYFDKAFIKEFCKSDRMPRYRNHISKQKHSNFGDLLQKHSGRDLFERFPKYKKSILFLDCFLDWLGSTKLRPGSNEYFKNKCAMEMFDMRNPQNWFTISQDRHFIYHHGPTNSGKTSSAIKELKELPKDKKGIYMAPLRLLAWQMQQKLENCNLITGQDKEFRVSNLTSCTIEALNTSDEYDVAIIDEIQMIGDYERGWSWTKALISTKAKRIHLCGDERAIGLVSKLIKDCGGTLEERRYSRLGKLKLIPKIFEMKNIEEGDCLIQFSVQTLHKLRKKIKDELQQRKLKGEHGHQSDQSTQLQKHQSYVNLKEGEKECHIAPRDGLEEQKSKECSQVAMVYGRLPPECRKEEARKFNAKIAPYLVATNAIGMGLNLNIKKIIFAGIKRRNSKGDQVDLQEHEIQQIAGRAGRGLNDGLVQCASHQIFKKVRKALRNVNKTYGINLEDEALNEQSKAAVPTENRLLLNQEPDNNNNAEQSERQDLQIYNVFLKRLMTEKQRKIQKAGLFIQYIFLKRMMMFLSENFPKPISLSRSTKYYLDLSLKSDKLYFVSEKNELLDWVRKLEDGFKLETRDIFEIAKGLSMHYNSFYSQKKMLLFASQFERKGRVTLPKESIAERNLKKVSNNFKKLDILQANYSVVQIYIHLWSKYEFVFGDIQEAKELKDQISDMIKEVLEDEDGFHFSKSQNKSNTQKNGERGKREGEEEIEGSKEVTLQEETTDIQKLKL